MATQFCQERHCIYECWINIFLLDCHFSGVMQKERHSSKIISNKVEIIVAMETYQIMKWSAWQHQRQYTSIYKISILCLVT